ncbi:hypothetical protein [Bacteroides fluxus]
MEANIKSKLNQEIQNGCSVETLTNLCQEIVFNEISAKCANAEIENMIKELCKRLDFSIKTRTVNLLVKQKSANPPLKEAIGYSLCGISYYLFYKLTGVHIVGGLAGIAAGLLYNIGTKDKNGPQATASPGIIISSTVAEIEKSVDSAVSILLNIINLISKKQSGDGGITPPAPPEYPLENEYFVITKYLYDNYIKCLAQPNRDTFQMESIELLFENYGYELIEYTENDREYFNASTANIPERTTTCPALLNKETRKCVCKGHVLFPLHN